jgi:transposase
MASLYPRRIAGKTYWYLREMARVDGKPKMVSERYVASAAEVAALLDAREQAGPGTYLALAALNRLIAPRSKAAFADWWKSTAADRFTKITARALDHRWFWDTMHAVTAQQLERIGQAIALRLIEVSGVDVSSVALDMTNFATFIATANQKAPLAQRGKAKQKRSDLRLVKPR